VLESVCSILQRATSVYIATHIFPDGDAIGSALGLSWALSALGKQCTVACNDPASPSLSFLPGSQTIVRRLPASEDVIVVLDTGDPTRLGAVYAPEAYAGRTVINIDHHLSNSRFGTVNIVEPSTASVGEMVYGLVLALGVSVDATIATCLLTAMVTDTIGFRTPSTTPQTLRIAATLVEAGAPLSEIVRQSFENRPLPVMRMWGEVLRAYSVQDGVAWAAIPSRLMKRYGIAEDDIKGLVNVLGSTQGVLVSVLIMESDDSVVRAEFRSDGKVNVATIATALGGGGHRAASGCTVAGPLAAAEERILSEVRRNLDGAEREHRPAQ
jgi:phosphoesterase RecJ-like protein